MIHLLDRNVKEHWTYFAELVERVENFCVRYDSDADPKILSNILITHFTQYNDNMLLLVSIVDNKVVAHLVAGIDTWCGAKYGTIIQYEANRGEMPLEDKQQGYWYLENWATKHQAQLQILARNPQMAKLFNRYWGFKPERILMRKRIS